MTNITPVSIGNSYGEERVLVSYAWGGETCFYFDDAGLAYEQYPEIDGEPFTFEQISSGDRWEALQ